MSGKTYFITGANRGIGFQIAKELAAKSSDNVIIGTARDPTKPNDFSTLAESNPNLHLIKLDVQSIESIKELDAQLESVAPDGIDIFISNAGIAKPEAFKPVLETDYDLWIDHYTTNVTGAVFTTKVVHKYLLKKQTRHIVFISTAGASLTNFAPLSSSAYGQSKAALNHAALSLSNELKGDKFVVVVVHPGAVSTEMGKEVVAVLPKEAISFIESLSITPEVSGESIAKLVEELNYEKNGLFLNYDGTELQY